MADGAITYKVTVDNKGALKSIQQVGDAAQDSGKKGAQGIDGIGGAVKKVAGIIAASAIVAKILDIGRAAIDAYANYEQLVGGVETLFKDSAGVVQEYAANAYKTAGMSANQYMETVTSFSASLLQGLGGDTEAAAKYADMAITDMADNANKMGTSMESIQNAYQGFAKQNYTMLDNLKLGYGGTKSEMERLIQDANKIKEANGEMADLSIDSYADIVEAIHLVQDEMGITGTTAEEAASTIQGSASMMQAAWENLLVGMVDQSADKTKLMQDLFGSVKTYLGNLLPAIGSLIMGAIQALPELLGGILDIVTDVINGIGDNAEGIIDVIIDLVARLVKTIIDHAPDLIMAAGKLVLALAKGLINSVGKLVAAGVEMLGGVLQGVQQGAQGVLDWFAGLPGRILSAIGDTASLLWNAGSQIITGFFDGLKAAFGPVADFIGGIGGWIQEHKGPEDYDKHLLIKQGQWIMESLAAGLEYGKADVMATLQGISADIAGYSVAANLAPIGAANQTTNVFVNGMTAANPNVLAAGSAFASEIMLDLRMG